MDNFNQLRILLLRRRRRRRTNVPFSLDDLNVLERKLTEEVS